MKYAICAVGASQSYWLVQIGQTTQHRWRSGNKGRKMARRFDTKADAAQFIFKTRLSGASGANPEVVEVED